MKKETYKVPFIRPNYTRFYAANKKAILKEFDYCMANGELTLRNAVWNLESNIAKFVGAKYAVGVNSGTDALFLSLLALGIGKGDEVITCSNTFIASIQAIVHTGATPILVDVDENELMNLDEVEKVITVKTKAIMPIEYTGAMVDMKRLTKIAKKHKLYIVDDFCQALGASQDGKMAGSFGILNAVSFNTAKLLGGLCDGGMVTTDSRELYEKICLLRNHWNVHQLSVDRKDYPQPEHMEWAWKSRLSNVNAAFLGVKFKTIKKIIKRREQIALKYNKAFADLHLGLPHEEKGRIFQEYHLKVPANKREEFAKFLAKRGIETLTRDVVPNHRMKGLELDHFELPMTEQLAGEVIRLPLHEWLTDKEVDYVTKSVKEFYAKQ